MYTRDNLHLLLPRYSVLHIPVTTFQNYSYMEPHPFFKWSVFGLFLGVIVGSRNDKNSIARKRTYAETVANYVTPRVAPQIAVATHVES